MCGVRSGAIDAHTCRTIPRQISSRFARRGIRRLGLRPALRFAPGSQIVGTLGGYVFRTRRYRPYFYGVAADYTQAVIMLLVRPIDADQGDIRFFFSWRDHIHLQAKRVEDKHVALATRNPYSRDLLGVFI